MTAADFCRNKPLASRFFKLRQLDVFWSLAIIGALMVPLALIIRPVDLGAAPKGH